MDVMLDIETLSTGPNAAIVQVGAVLFEAVGGGHVLLGSTPEGVDRLFSRYIRPAPGTTVDAETVAWWLWQQQRARSRLAHGLLNSPHSEEDAMRELLDWPSSLGYKWEDMRVWSHGPSFGAPLLEAAFCRSGVLRRAPWSYSMLRDTGTLFELAGGEPEIEGPHEHDAGLDVVRMACRVQAAMDRIGIKKRR